MYIYKWKSPPPQPSIPYPPSRTNAPPEWEVLRRIPIYKGIINRVASPGYHHPGIISQQRLRRQSLRIRAGSAGRIQSNWIESDRMNSWTVMNMFELTWTFSDHIFIRITLRDPKKWINNRSSCSRLQCEGRSSCNSLPRGACTTAPRSHIYIYIYIYIFIYI